MNKEQLGNTLGEFVWCWNKTFFIETCYGNFVWSDPDYPGGDGTITRFDGSYEEFIKQQNIPYGRDKGKHIIKEYCGDFVYVSGKDD